jgi:chromosome segregation ATPase
MATCAACRQPFLSGQGFRIVGHEVVHTSCVGRRTVNQTLVERIDRIEPRLSTAESTAAANRGELTRLELEQARLRAEIVSHRVERNDLQRQRDDAIAQATTAARERDQARAELATQRAQIVTPEPTESQETDATILRFGLLELD